MPDYSSLLDGALDLAQTAESQIMPRFRSVTATRKPDGTEVTEADREAERRMRTQIEDRYPDHAILGEEFGATGPDNARYRWILDPLDGTAGFTLGVPLFGTLVGLLDEGEPVVGVIHFPAIGETVYAAQGDGCWFRADDMEPERVRVDPVTDLSAATASTTALHSSDVMAADEETPYRMTELVRRAGKFRFVTDCLQHALVARGRMHVAVDTIMSPWDVAALVPCVREAGGVAEPIDDPAADVVFAGSLVTAASPDLARTARNILQPGKRS
jgi:histidinol-phosphatase